MRKTNWLPREVRPTEPNVKIPCKDSRNWMWPDPSRNELYDNPLTPGETGETKKKRSQEAGDSNIAILHHQEPFV